MDLSSMKLLSKKYQGSQGVVGYCTYDHIPCVYKRSKEVNCLIQHEWNIMQSVKDIPHFCRGIDITNVDQQDYLIMNSYRNKSLGDFIHMRKSSQIKSLFLQTLAALQLARQKNNFTHYDMHPDNILFKSTPYEYHEYVFEDHTSHFIRTYGIEPVIIDFGHAYTDDCHKFECMVEFMDEGQTCYESDPLADLRLLCTTTLHDLRKYHPKSLLIPTLASLDIMSSLPTNHSTGWYLNGTLSNLLTKVKSILPPKQSLYHIKHPCLKRRHLSVTIELFLNQLTLPLTPPKTNPETDIEFQKHWYELFNYLHVPENMKPHLCLKEAIEANTSHVKAIMCKLQDLAYKVRVTNENIKTMLYNDVTSTLLGTIDKVNDVITTPSKNNVLTFT